MFIIACALFFTVALLVTTAYFILGGLPLLILDHSTPLDGRFISRFFEVYCKAAWFTALGASLSYLLAGLPWFALGTLGIAAAVWAYRRTIIPGMQALTLGIERQDARALRTFRLTHASALLINLLQLAALVWGVLRLKF